MITLTLVVMDRDALQDKVTEASTSLNVETELVHLQTELEKTKQKSQLKKQAESTQMANDIPPEDIAKVQHPWESGIQFQKILKVLGYYNLKCLPFILTQAVAC